MTYQERLQEIISLTSPSVRTFSSSLPFDSGLTIMNKVLTGNTTLSIANSTVNTNKPFKAVYLAIDCNGYTLSFDPTIKKSSASEDPDSTPGVINNIYVLYDGTRFSYELHKINSESTPVPVTPSTPTSGVVDDTANTFNWTNTPSFTALSDYEYTVNSGTSYATVTAKPIQVGNIGKAIGTVGVRVKSVGINPASATLYNASSFSFTGTQPAAPTGAITDDTANTFNWTNSAASSTLSDYEYTLNAGSTTAIVTAKPLVIGNNAYASGQVGVRVKAIGGNPASNWLFNIVAFNVTAPSTDTIAALTPLIYVDMKNSTVTKSGDGENILSISNMGSLGGAATGNSPYNVALDNVDLSMTEMLLPTTTDSSTNSQYLVAMFDMEGKDQNSAYEHYFYGSGKFGIGDAGTYFRQAFNGAGTPINLNNAIPLTGRHTLVAIRNHPATNLKVYIDGVKQADTTLPTGGTSMDGVFGGGAYYQWFGGFLTLAYGYGLMTESQAIAIHNELTATHAL